MPRRWREDPARARPLPANVVRNAWLLLPVGVGLVGWSMALASRVTDPSDNGHFPIFWLGALTAFLPLFWLSVHPRTEGRDRLFAIGGVGFLSVVPKALAYPGQPAFFDEYAHWSQIQRLFDEGLAFMPNRQVVVIGDYPAIHLLANAVRHFAGLSTYVTGLVCLVVFHALCLWAVYSIALRLTQKEQAGGIAAMWYAVGPGFWYFNAQFAYEALGVTLFSWSTVVLIQLVTTPAEDRDRDRWMAFGMLILGTIIATHHLSSYLNVGVIGAGLVVLVVAAAFRRTSRSSVAELAIYGLIAAGLTFWWYLSQAPRTRAYMEPYVRNGLVGVTQLGNTGNGDSGQRQLFSGSTIPPLEQMLSFAVPVICGLCFGAAALRIWVRRRWTPAVVVIGAVGALFFAVFPMMLSASGAEGARRSWSFTNLGVAVVIAVAVVAADTSAGVLRSGIGRAAAGVLAATLFVGFVAIGANETYRFPGEYVYGSDTRSVTNELDGAARWFERVQGRDQPIVADRSAQLAFSYAADASLAVPSNSNPVWNLIVEERPLTPSQLRAMNASEMGFVVVDKHQILAIPQIGFYMDQNEPLAQQRQRPLAASSLTKFDEAGWIQRIYSSDTLDIYRVLRRELLEYVDDGN